jgi:hypothetical protein
MLKNSSSKLENGTYMTAVISPESLTQHHFNMTKEIPLNYLVLRILPFSRLAELTLYFKRLSIIIIKDG